MKITLDKFVEEKELVALQEQDAVLYNHVHQFSVYWLAWHKELPDEFPVLQEKGVWEDEFKNFVRR